MLPPSLTKLEKDQKRLDLLQLHRRQWHQLVMHQTVSRRQLTIRLQAEQAELASDQYRYGAVLTRQLTELSAWMHANQQIRNQLRVQQRQELLAMKAAVAGD